MVHPNVGAVVAHRLWCNEAITNADLRAYLLEHMTIPLGAMCLHRFQSLSTTDFEENVDSIRALFLAELAAAEVNRFASAARSP